ncbi:MAG: hypothetical protein H6735_29495, partial [Alphaproteobacteria bacterium]|nr:hypothetical protein [Alphaproteobacteria bacterium]
MMRTAPLLLLLGLAGCPWIGADEWASVEDADGDGVRGDRFGGPDCRDDDPSIQYCDFDEDGFLSIEVGGDDCDDRDATVHPGLVFWMDLDGDGFGDPTAVIEGCEAPPSTVVPGLEDCDDGRAEVHPGAVETCDDLDRDCDGDPYAGADGDLFFVDADRDGYGAELSTVSGCVPGPGYSLRDDDCDDGDASVNPGADETWYDGVDQDCDGWPDDDQDHDGEAATTTGGPDCDDLDPERNTTAPERCNGIDDDCDLRVDDEDDDDDQIDQIPAWQDADRDGYGSLVQGLFCSNAIPDGWSVLGGDCRDDLAPVHPGGVERCNRIDDDCNGVVDDGVPLGAVTVYADVDGDGWGDLTAATQQCEAGASQTLLGGDCDDGDPDTHPGAPEICGDPVRQDCDANLSPYDCDGDGSATDDPVPDCLDDPTDPDAASIHPGAAEVCDGRDNDCNGLSDGADPGVDLNTASAWYTDLDHDGFGSGVPTLIRCTPPPDAANNDLDCDDTNAARNPAAPEACNTIDDDCDGQVDEGATVGLTTYYRDLDGDGFGADATAQGACTAPGASWTALAGDCDDLAPAIHPGADEACNALDDDCDGLLDGADPGLVGPIWYADADGDGWGLQSDGVAACTQQPGRVTTPGDCDDARADRNPGTDEVCDGGLDNDCDGLADDADPDLAAVTTFYRDRDTDGFGDAATTVHQCGQPPGYVTNPFDCVDTDPSINPVAPEICDGTDNDCDNATDDADPSVTGRLVRFRDDDTDGYGSLPFLTCDPGAGSALSGDCDDANPGIHPNATELCDQTDQDCDQQIDEGAQPQLTWWVDADSDGFGASGPFDRVACSRPAGYALAGTVDCDDSDRTIWPGQTVEYCDGEDNDCDTLVDDADTDTTLLAPFAWLDEDLDGYGAGAPVPICVLPASGWSREGGDCDPLDPAITPLYGCSGSGGVGGPSVLGTPGKWWHDDDADGYGDFSRPPVLSSSAPGGFYANNPLDCDDGDPSDVYLAGVESVAALQAGLNNPLPCTVFVLPDQFDAPATVSINPPMGANVDVRIASGGRSPAILRQQNNASVITSNQSLQAFGVILHQLHVIGTSTSSWLLNVTSCSSDFGMADLELEGAPGLYATGQIKEDGDWYHGLPPLALTGAAINSQYGTHDAVRVRVEGVRTPAANASVYLATGGTFEGLVLEDSGPLRLSPQFGNLTVLDAHVRSAINDAVVVEGMGSGVTLDGLVVTDAGDAGLLLTGGMPMTIDHVTIVGSGGYGVEAGGYAFGSSLRDAIVWDSGLTDLYAAQPFAFSANRVMFSTKNANVSG